MKRSKRLIFFGNERLATGLESTDTPTLRALIDNDYEVAAIVSSQRPNSGRRQRPLEIAQVAADHNIPLLLPDKLSDFADQLNNYNAEVGVLVAFGRIIPQSVIDVFPHGIINIHPSLLPQYRGPTPVETAILEGVNETGVSLMSLAKDMDAGPVYAQEELKLTGKESKADLARQLLGLGSAMLIDKLPAILGDELTPIAQDGAKASYTKLIEKSDGQMNFDQPADRLERQVRAFAGWPRSRTQLFQQQIVVLVCHVTEKTDQTELAIACKPGFLVIDELLAPSGRKMSGADFIRGYKKS